MKKIVIMPGGFHPFHAGHYALYQSAKKAFPDADVYVAASDSRTERPFPFQIKQKLAQVAGVKPNEFVQVKSPFRSEEITAKYDPKEDVLIFVRSEKDKTEQPLPGGTKKDGTPAYFQPYNPKDMKPFNQHGYMAYLPTVEFAGGIKSATEIRKQWPHLNTRQKQQMVQALYPNTTDNKKLIDNVVQMINVGMGELTEGELVAFKRNPIVTLPDDLEDKVLYWWQIKDTDQGKHFKAAMAQKGIDIEHHDDMLDDFVLVKWRKGGSRQRAMISVDDIMSKLIKKAYQNPPDDDDPYVAEQNIWDKIEEDYYWNVGDGQNEPAAGTQPSEELRLKKSHQYAGAFVEVMGDPSKSLIKQKALDAHPKSIAERSAETVGMLGAIAGMVAGTMKGIDWLDHNSLTQIVGAGIGAVVGTILGMVPGAVAGAMVEPARRTEFEEEQIENFLYNNPNVLKDIDNFITKAVLDVPDNIIQYSAEINDLFHHSHNDEFSSDVSELIDSNKTKYTNAVARLLKKYLESKESDWEQLAKKYKIDGNTLRHVYDHATSYDIIDDPDDSLENAWLTGLKKRIVSGSPQLTNQSHSEIAQKIDPKPKDYSNINPALLARYKKEKGLDESIAKIRKLIKETTYEEKENTVHLHRKFFEIMTEGTRETIPSVLYHATYRPLLKSIEKNGLGGRGSRAKWEDSIKGAVYLAIDPNVAESYAETSDAVPDEWLDKIVILKISTAGLDHNKFQIDRNVLDNTGDTLEYNGIIPVSNISILKKGVVEGGAETSWSDDKDTITLQDMLELTKHIKQINLLINDNLKSKLIHWDGNPEEIERINQVTVSKQFPILVMLDGKGQIDWILDGNHRLHKAIQSQAETIPAKLIKPSDLSDKAKKIFYIRKQGVAEGEVLNVDFRQNQPNKKQIEKKMSIRGHYLHKIEEELMGLYEELAEAEQIGVLPLDFIDLMDDCLRMIKFLHTFKPEDHPIPDDNGLFLESLLNRTKIIREAWLNRKAHTFETFRNDPILAPMPGGNVDTSGPKVLRSQDYKTKRVGPQPTKFWKADKKLDYLPEKK